MRLQYAGLDLGEPQGGGPTEVMILEVDFSYPEIRTSDRNREARDGVTAGRDYFGARVATFSAKTNLRDMLEARAKVSEVLAAWREARVRLRTGVLAPLDYQYADDPQWRRVYGRPRRSDDPSPDRVMRQGAAVFDLDFEVLDPRVYAGGDEGLVSETIRLVEGPSAGSLWVPPWTWPAVPGLGRSERRPGALQIEGEIPTPVTVAFQGPGRGFSLDGTRGWHVGLRPSVELAYDEQITIDPLTGTVTDNRGNDRYGALDRRTQLLSDPLSPGMENVFFSATDPTHTASATVSWRPAYASL